MNDLVTKYTLMKWDDDSLSSFEYIKETITKAHVLISPDYSGDITIFSFASQDTIVSLQLKKNKDNYEKPISLMRKTLRYIELKYSITEK
jgi:hypothetical protein